MAKNIYTVKSFKLYINGKTKVSYWLGDTIREGEDLKYFANRELYNAKPYECEFFFTQKKANERIEELIKEAKERDELLWNPAKNEYLWKFDWEYDKKLGANVVKEDKRK